jgi:hypothetical protein
MKITIYPNQPETQVITFEHIESIQYPDKGGYTSAITHEKGETPKAILLVNPAAAFAVRLDSEELTKPLFRYADLYEDLKDRLCNAQLLYATGISGDRDRDDVIHAVLDKILAEHTEYVEGYRKKSWL